MDGPELLLIPGPVSVDDEVLEALARPVRAHYGSDWGEEYARLLGALGRLFRTQGDVLLIFGPGSAATETALASTLAPGDAVIVASNGMFGERLVKVAETIGLRVHPVLAEAGDPVAPEAVEAALRAHPETRALAMVHHETSCGVLNPVRELAGLGRERGLLTYVDAISSFGGVELQVDEWGIDLCASVANKCLGGPIGVAPLAVGERAWAAVDDGRPKAAGWYLNLRTWREARAHWGDYHPYPVTMPTSVIEALKVAVEHVESVGLEAHQRLSAQAAARVREGLRELGFAMVVEDRHASPVCTAAWALPGMDVTDYIDWMRRERGLRLGGGLGPKLVGRTFRVGHMARAADPAVVDAYLRATSDYVETRIGRIKSA
ncbi:MAG: aminotransferase class V-fold PLP-dependent enzyme [Candidatus Dormibacteraeota bacterium]|nr:aminotransferase class V-fold PLP-dependent enzyme [Candidatus Dormibacteraeota bacterium]